MISDRLFVSLFPGDHSEEVTPVPIPNTEVKSLSGDGTVAIGRGRVARRRDFFTRPCPDGHGLFLQWKSVFRGGTDCACPIKCSFPIVKPKIPQPVVGICIEKALRHGAGAEVRPIDGLGVSDALSEVREFRRQSH